MSTFADDIQEAAGEPIEAVVIGKFGWGDDDDPPGKGYGETEHPIIPADKRWVVLSWDEARPLLDYEYDIGFGAPDCHAVNVWTANKILWVTQYDGSTGLSSAPRNPGNIKPEMPGG